MSRLEGTGFSVTAHAHDIFVDQDHLDVVLRGATFVVAISEFNRRFLIERDLVGETPVDVVRCGVSPERYPFRAPDGEHRPVRLLCVASLQEYKGHAVLLAALGELRDLPLELELIGDGVLRDTLREQAETLRVADRVLFRGTRDEQGVIEALDGADVFVHPSVVARDGQMDGIPVALMEAIARGIPSVASDLSGIPELVRKDETGLLVAPGDPIALAGAIRSIVADPAAAAARAVAGRQLIEREYDVRRSAAILARRFRERV